MTRDEAIKMVKAKLECMTRDVSGRDNDCINRRCDECSLNYEQGNMGEQKEWLRMAIEALQEHQHYKDLAESYEKTINKLTKAIAEQASSSGKTNKWIPISKETPKENGYYLTTTMLGEVYCDFWCEIAFDRTETVIAWMPLPAPFKPQERDDESCDEIWEKAYAERDGKK